MRHPLLFAAIVAALTTVTSHAHLIKPHCPSPQPPKTPTGKAKTCHTSMVKLPSIQSICNTFLASEHSLIVTSTVTATSVVTLTTPTTTSISTIYTPTYSPIITATATSTLLTSTVTTIPVTSTSTTTVTESSTTVTSTDYYSTITTLVVPTPTPRRRSLDKETSVDDLMEKRSMKVVKRNKYSSAIQSLLNFFGTAIVTDACLYVVYGPSKVVPTSYITATRTSTSSPATVTSTVSTTITTPMASTTTVTTTTTSFTDTITESPTIVTTSTSTITPTSIVSAISTVPATRATGMVALPTGYATVDVEEYTNYVGTAITADGGGSNKAVLGTYCYDVASQNFLDCTGTTPTLAAWGANTGTSYIFIGKGTALQCTLASAADVDGQTPLSCTVGGTSTQFYTCPNQNAIYFPTDQTAAANQGCKTLDLYFMPTMFS